MAYRDDPPWKAPVLLIIGGVLVWGISSIGQAYATGRPDVPEALITAFEILRWLSWASIGASAFLALGMLAALLILRARKHDR